MENKSLKRKAFNFYSSYDDAFELLNEKQQVKLFKAIRDVQFFRKHIDNVKLKDKELMFAWLIMKHSIERQILGYCRANKIKYDCLKFDTPKDTLGVTPRVTPKDTPLQEEVQGEVQEEVEYTIVAFLNKKANTIYKPSSKKTKFLIQARLKEGFTVDNFKTVIIKKCKEWLYDKKMSVYLRPETLFSNKFESYLNQIVVHQNTFAVNEIVYSQTEEF